MSEGRLQVKGDEDDGHQGLHVYLRVQGDVDSPWRTWARLSVRHPPSLPTRNVEDPQRSFPSPVEGVRDVEGDGRRYPSTLTRLTTTPLLSL